NFQVTGICDIDEEKLKAAAPSLGNPATGTDAAKMAKEIKPDVFCFCTMPHIRMDMLKIAVDCGAKMVAFEKPVALNMNEALKLKALVDKSGIKAVVSHQHRYGVHYRKIKEIAESGDLGRIEMIYASATGWMTHMMSHMVDYMRWYNGNVEAEWVMGQSAGKSKLSDNHPSPDYIEGVIQFANGVRGIVECGAGAPDQPEVAKWWGKNRICVQGTEGFAEVLTNGGWRAVTSKGVQKGEGAMNYDLDMHLISRKWLTGLLMGKSTSAILKMRSRDVK
ncbi:MAG: Gfo/Idh/MocA family oxidoreductase, partial [Lentisphaerota bacterium]